MTNHQNDQRANCASQETATDCAIKKLKNVISAKEVPAAAAAALLHAIHAISIDFLLLFVLFGVGEAG